MKYIPERLKSSLRLQAELLVGALTLLALKRELYPRYNGPTKGADILPPIMEPFKRSYFYLKSESDETDKPTYFDIGAKMRSVHIALQVRRDKEQGFVAESSPNRKGLRYLKKGIKLTRKKLLKQIRASQEH